MKSTSTLLTHVLGVGFVNQQIKMFIEILQGAAYRDMGRIYNIPSEKVRDEFSQLTYKLARHPVSSSLIVKPTDWDKLTVMRGHREHWIKAAQAYLRNRVNDTLNSVDFYLCLKKVAWNDNSPIDELFHFSGVAAHSWLEDTIEDKNIRSCPATAGVPFTLTLILSKGKIPINPGSYILIMNDEVDTVQVDNIDWIDISDEDQQETSEEVVGESIQEEQLEEIQEVLEPEETVVQVEVVEETVSPSVVIDEPELTVTITESEYTISTEQATVSLVHFEAPVVAVEEESVIETVVEVEEEVEVETPSTPVILGCFSNSLMKNMSMPESKYFRTFVEKLVGITLDVCEITDKTWRTYIVTYDELSTGLGRPALGTNDRVITMFVDFCKTMGLTVQRGKGQIIITVNIGVEHDLVLSEALTKRLLKFYGKKKVKELG